MTRKDCLVLEVGIDFCPEYWRVLILLAKVMSCAADENVVDNIFIVPSCVGMTVGATNCCVDLGKTIAFAVFMTGYCDEIERVDHVFSSQSWGAGG